MDSLRLILLGIGVLFIGGMMLYYWLTSDTPIRFPRFGGLKIRLLPRIRLARRHEAAPIPRNHPHLEDEPDADDIADLSGMTVPVDETDVGTEALNPISAVSPIDSQPTEPLIVVLNVMARSGKKFHGLDILNAVVDLGMKYGDMNLFHAYTVEEPGALPLCSLANTMEPGTFNIEHMAELETLGLSLFMQLPGPLDGPTAFERFLQLGRTLAERLDGELCDETRSVLTLQTIGHLKEKIETWRFKQKVDAIKKHRR
ncbi:MAG: cell division protein ZipA [Proteobacteria bacterium]|jgi:cell division protein ZipA|nr:cell division protein ZipA [Pseudomonadota bacterium]MCG6935279.1 cell division protein ZipA [Pseudomonadota bacterium]